MHRLIVEDFEIEIASRLRKIFDRRFKDPYSGMQERFMWDYWYVPGQYLNVRTQASRFFSPSTYTQLERALRQWGERELGCSILTDPWLTYYVDGCFQDFHTDSGHGPWAYVYSLTHWNTRSFSGGETILLRPTVLDYWQNLDGFARGASRENICEYIPARFGQLLVFDPRMPHAVRRVQGTPDPNEGRVVIHGWFTEPRLSVRGALHAEQAEDIVRRGVGSLEERLAMLGSASGLLSLKIVVNRSGDVVSNKILCDTVRTTSNRPHEIVKLRRMLSEATASWRFPRSRGSSTITVPFAFGIQYRKPDRREQPKG